MNKFSIQYPEYHIAGLLQESFKKSKHFSVSIPLSRQQKYYDLLLYNGSNRKSLTIQVKSSRTYIETELKEKKKKKFNYTAWLQNFKLTNEFTDFYFIYISYPLFDLKTFKPRTAAGVKVLVFDKFEMEELFKSQKLTKSGNPDTFFGFGFNIGEESIWGDRGFQKNANKDFEGNLYASKVSALREAIG